MHKINLKDFRFLHDYTDENIILLLNAGGSDFIDIDRETFRNSQGGYYKIDRKIIRETWKQRGLDTHKWSYWTNDAGLLLLNK